MNKNFFYACLLLACAFLFATGDAQTPPRDSTVTARKFKKPDYSYLLKYGESHTNIFGTVERKIDPKNAKFYSKGKLLSDTFHLLNHGAKFEVLNPILMPNKTMQHLLIKVIDNPPANEFAGDTGWISVQYTSLATFIDRDKNAVDTNYFYTKYMNAAAKSREDAGHTKCPNNKKCYLEWADYYDCMKNGSRYGSKPNCALVNCAIQDCPDDK